MKCFNKYLKTLFCTVLMLGVGSVFTFAQTVQHGVVMEYHDKSAKTPLGNVAIAATNAGATISDATGAFTLSFRTLKPGDGIQFRRIEKQGYEVMNKEAVEVMRVGSKDNADAIKIVLCSSRLLNQLRDGYRSVSVQRYQQQLKQAEKEAKRLKEQGQLKEDEYNTRLDELEAEYEEKLSNIDTYIDRFARIDLTELDVAERRIIVLVQEGKFDEAMDMYEQQGFVQKLQKSREEQRQLAEAKTKIESAIDAKAEEAEKLRQSIERQVNLLRMAGGKENLDKVHEILKEVFLADETNVEARRDYANSLFQNGETDEACSLLETGLGMSKEVLDKCFLAVDLASYYDMKSEYEASFMYAAMADSLATLIKDLNYKTKSQIMPSVTQILLMYNINDKHKCESIIKKLEDNWMVDSLNVNSLLDYSQTVDMMIYFYSLYSYHEKARQMTDVAISLNQYLHNKSKWHTALDRCYASASQIYMFEGMYDKAKDFALKSIELAEERLEKSPLASQIMETSAVYYQATEVLNNIDKYDAADEVLAKAKARHVYEIALERGNNILSEYSGLSKFHQALSELRKNNIKEAELLVQNGYDILLKTEKGCTYAETQKHFYLGRVRQHQRSFDEAKKEYEQAIAMAAEQYKDESDDWNADTYCCFLVQYADLMGEMGDKSEFKKQLKNAAKVAVFKSNDMKIDNVKQKYINRN